MNVKVNGDPMELAQGLPLRGLLEKLNLKPELVVVELNLNILKRDDLGGVTLKEGDQVEIVHFVGGGAGVASPGPAPGPRTGTVRPVSSALRASSVRALTSRAHRKRGLLIRRPRSQRGGLTLHPASLVPSACIAGDTVPARPSDVPLAGPRPQSLCAGQAPPPTPAARRMR